MKPQNNYTIISPDPPPQPRQKVTHGYKRGYSEHTQQLYSNSGYILTSNTYKTGEHVHYYSVSEYKIDDQGIAVPDQNIFMLGSKILHPGVLCKKRVVNQTRSGVNYRTQKFYTVTQSTCDIETGGVVIANRSTGERVYLDGEPHWYIPEDNITVYVSNVGHVQAGHSYELLDQVQHNAKLVSYSKAIKGLGAKNGVQYLFVGRPDTITLNSHPRWLVRKSNIIGEFGGEFDTATETANTETTGIC